MSDKQFPKQEVTLAELLEAAKVVLSSPIILFVGGQVTVINADEIYDPFPEKKEAEDAHGPIG
jgi:hypothetical protein